MENDKSSGAYYKNVNVLLLEFDVSDPRSFLIICQMKAMREE